MTRPPERREDKQRQESSGRPSLKIRVSQRSTTQVSNYARLLRPVILPYDFTCSRRLERTLWRFLAVLRGCGAPRIEELRPHLHAAPRQRSVTATRLTAPLPSSSVLIENEENCEKPRNRESTKILELRGRADSDAKCQLCLSVRRRRCGRDRRWCPRGAR